MRYQANFVNLSFFTRSLTVFIAAIPTMRETAIPIIAASQFISTSPEIAAGTSRMLAARTAGTPIMKEKATACSRETPRISPVEIVEPERESPGRGAIPCMIPIPRACFQLMFSAVAPPVLTHFPEITSGFAIFRYNPS